jgi:hypothetical protein
MALVVQRIGARSLPKIFFVDDSVLTSFLSLLAGQVEVYSLKHSGGTAISTVPNPLNRVRISVRTVNSDGSMVSCSFTVPHVKETVDYDTLIGLIKGKFDAYWSDSAPKADDVAIIYDRVNAG